MNEKKLLIVADLHESEKRFWVTFDQMPIGIVHFSKEGADNYHWALLFEMD
jgi:hypothetical protein